MHSYVPIFTRLLSTDFAGPFTTLCYAYMVFGRISTLFGPLKKKKDNKSFCNFGTDTNLFFFVPTVPSCGFLAHESFTCVLQLYSKIAVHKGSRAPKDTLPSSTEMQMKSSFRGVSLLAAQESRIIVTLKGMH